MVSRTRECVKPSPGWTGWACGSPCPRVVRGCPCPEGSAGRRSALSHRAALKTKPAGAGWRRKVPESLGACSAGAAPPVPEAAACRTEIALTPRPFPSGRARTATARPGSAQRQGAPCGRRRSPPLGAEPSRAGPGRSGGPSGRTRAGRGGALPLPPQLRAAMSAGQAAGEAADTAAHSALPRVLSALFYGTCSFLIVLVNKAVLSAYR